MVLSPNVMLMLTGMAIVLFCSVHAESSGNLYEKVGCYKAANYWHTTRSIDLLDKDRKSIESCYEKSKEKGFSYFGVQSGRIVDGKPVGQCASSASAEEDYDKYGKSNDCNDKGTGGSWLNQIYKINAVLELEAQRTLVNAEAGGNAELHWQLSETGKIITEDFYCTKKSDGAEADAEVLVRIGDQGDRLDIVKSEDQSEEFKDLVSRTLILEATTSSTSTIITTTDIILQDLKVSDSGTYECWIEYTKEGDMQIVDSKTTKLIVSPKETIIEEDQLTCTTTEDGGCVEWKSEKKRITAWKGMSQPECEELCRVTPECADYNYQASGKTCRLFKAGCTIQKSSPLRQFYRCERTTATVADQTTKKNAKKAKTEKKQKKNNKAKTEKKTKK